MFLDQLKIEYQIRPEKVQLWIRSQEQLSDRTYNEQLRAYKAFRLVKVCIAQDFSIVKRISNQIRSNQLILPLLSSPAVAAAVAACRRRRRKSRSDHFGEEIPSLKSSSSFLVQTDEGIGISVVDRIRRPKPPTVEVPISSCIDRSRAPKFNSSAVPRERDPDPSLRQQFQERYQ
ncbi:protein LUTEIN DEFICIENT 5, chloroplastic [Dorcoceras hygrometricum]|uniref:Protein LUTEIN DEFICIENT 5, chloroplastic n=1 Tax=Dorcoceras hygrometricum TaxID=472368 RepID=A0A2Z7CTL5_9LAMI|nr:protein LUTEIN DEFICIENT 5, chloroplastic [Dorcoceras hygrometricum]